MLRKIRRLLAGLAFGLLALFAIQPAAADQPPGAQIVRFGDNSGIRIPASSPVQFIRIGKDLDAHFAGEFILTGTYQYGCFVGCDEPLTGNDLVLRFYPDHALARRLPTWTQYRYIASDIIIEKPDPFVRKLVGPRLRRELLTGKRNYVSGRASIIVDDFTLGIECDSPAYSARFVSFAAMPKTQKFGPIQPVGCG